MNKTNSQKKFYEKWQYWIILVGAILFLIAFGICSEKNAPKDQYMPMRGKSNYIC